MFFRKKPVVVQNEQEPKRVLKTRKESFNVGRTELVYEIDGQEFVRNVYGFVHQYGSGTHYRQLPSASTLCSEPPTVTSSLDNARFNLLQRAPMLPLVDDDLNPTAAVFGNPTKVRIGNTFDHYVDFDVAYLEKE